MFRRSTPAISPVFLFASLRSSGRTYVVQAGQNAGMDTQVYLLMEQSWRREEQVKKEKKKNEKPAFEYVKILVASILNIALSLSIAYPDTREERQIRPTTNLKCFFLSAYSYFIIFMRAYINYYHKNK